MRLCAAIPPPSRRGVGVCEAQVFAEEVRYARLGCMQFHFTAARQRRAD